jgi:hypothetical protein
MLSKYLVYLLIVLISTTESLLPVLSDQDKISLKEWGFTEHDIEDMKKTQWIDNIKNPVMSTNIQKNINWHLHRKKTRKLPDLTPQDYFTVLSPLYWNGMLAPHDSNVSMPDLLLLVPHLIGQGNDPNAAIQLEWFDEDRGLYHNVSAPLIFLAIGQARKGDLRLLALLLEYPQVDVNARESERQEDFRAKERLDRDLLRKTRDTQTPLHFIIRAIANKPKNMKKWLPVLSLLLQRPDVDINAPLKFYDSSGNVIRTETPFTLAAALEDSEVLSMLRKVNTSQSDLREEKIAQLLEQPITTESALHLSPLAQEASGQSTSVVSTSSGGSFPVGAQPFSLKPHAPKDIKGASGKPDRYPIKLPEGISIPRPDLTLSAEPKITKSYEFGNWIPSYFNKNNLIIATLCGIIYKLWNTPKKVKDADSVEQSKNVTCIIDTENDKDLNISSVQEERE